ncbi:uncharacterized protein METZ01_LOCUS201659 [marine metagenome]|uniref:Uncharacterized protein n=1 Tax=marine metagenome TaxID=408172 RepID=A0A382EEA2_9ZZZZ
MRKGLGQIKVFFKFFSGCLQKYTRQRLLSGHRKAAVDIIKAICGHFCRHPRRYFHVAIYNFDLPGP